MVQVINNQVIQTYLPLIGILSDGRCVSNYNLLPMDTLTEEGWLPLIEDKPIYNQEMQYLQHSEYIITTTNVTEKFVVVDIPIDAK